MTLRKFEREHDILAIISWLWMMPLLSLPELATVTGLTYHRCNRLTKDLYHQGRVTSVRLGMTLGLQRRWFLTTGGIRYAMQELGYAPEWQVSEAGLKLLIQRLPTLEAFYPRAPRLWSLSGIESIHPIHWSPDPDEYPIEFPAGLRLTRFQWQRDPDVHAITEYENGAWVPWATFGPMTKVAQIREKLGRGLATVDSRSRTRETPAAAGWVVLGADRLAASYAATVFSRGAALVMSVEGGTQWRMRPREFTLPACFENGRTNDLGVPERIPAWVKKDPVVSALNGAVPCALFRFICQWCGVRVGQLHKRFTHSHGEINAALRSLVRGGVIVRLDGAYYPTRDGMLAAARMDRVSHQSIYGYFDVYLKADGNYRRARQKHDQAVIDYVLKWSSDHGEVFHGRRFVVPVINRTQLAPDAIAVGGRHDGSTGMWFVEVELSAKAPSSVRDKLRPYREYQQYFGQSVDLMVVVGTEGAEKVFLEQGRGLNITTITLDRFLKSDPHDDPWQRP